ncbi:hypothetical protein [Limnohabitans sp. 2KL-1]|uniref:hypothetical protein n=1 Tax=Limnohabitans sp. 2KL-1 TaxID=1100699 RepID=UPI0011B292A9|nr:hypothetical protein [Limnohabitans sp. 2KL-1]
MWPKPVHAVMANVKNIRPWIFGYFLIFVAPSWADSVPWVGWSPHHTLTFAQEVQMAVRANDVGQLSSLTSFPLQVNLSSGRSIRMTRSHFYRYFSQVFTPQVRTAVEKQNLNTVLETQQGAMYSVGDVWFSSVCVDKSCSHRALKIMMVNVF